MDTYKENFIARIQRLKNEVIQLNTPVGFENIIDDAINLIRHFNEDINGVNIAKEKKGAIEELNGIKKTTIAESLKIKAPIDNEQELSEKIAISITGILEKFIASLRLQSVDKV